MLQKYKQQLRNNYAFSNLLEGVLRRNKSQIALLSATFVFKNKLLRIIYFTNILFSVVKQTNYMSDLRK